MRYRSVLVLFSFIFLVSCKKHPVTDLTKMPMIPLPSSVTATDGVFELSKSTSIYTDHSPAAISIAAYLSSQLAPATGFEISVASTGPDRPEGSVFLSLIHDKELGEEGYVLEISEGQLKLSANSAAGLFHGVQTIRQLLPAQIEKRTKQNASWEIPTGTIRDFPLYMWRGAMLDVARHFFSVDDVKRYIDLIAAYKMNVLHLHLSDDQGWRVEIKSWPNLTAIGGSTQVGGGKGGFYTQEQYKEIVAYATSRHITIVPEIDLPGHINSALASYGELNGGTIVPAEGRVVASRPASVNDLGKKDKSKPTDLYKGIAVGWSTLRVEKPRTFKFIDDVLTELAALTPGPYLHIGGDEAAATKKEDYIVFVNRFKDIVKSKGKIMVGWEEIAQGDLNGDVITQYWHSSKYARMAAEKGSRIIMSPSKKAYMDMKYDSTTTLGLHWAAYIEIDSAYRWDPATLATGLPVESILGVEAPLWSETIATMDDIEYLLFPRLPGYAEIGWTKPSMRKWEEYKLRLGAQAPRFDAMEINYYKSKQVPWAK